MDSKYSAIINIPNKPAINNFLTKRKHPNNQPNLNNCEPKKIKPYDNSKNIKNHVLSGQENNQTVPQNIQRSLQELRKSLPVYRVRASLLKHLTRNDTLVVIGETGSGKTTQIPQFLWEKGLAKDGIIAITQPRRMAAITVAQRVAQEKGGKLGELVGYTVRFEDVTSNRTRIKYMTDGLLLREALSDRLLLKYSIIVLDEAHERTVNTDVLFGIVKEAQKTRHETNLKPLRLVIMSATMDVPRIQSYFNTCIPVLLMGRSYPITMFYTKHLQPNYVFSCVVTLFELHKTAPPQHDVLIFLTGQEEIEAVTHQIREIAKDQRVTGPIIRVYPLYSALSPQKQMEVFRPTAPNSRKVVVCTNIAETSLTISGIRYVIDGGFVKTRTHDATTGMERLKVMPISQAQAKQRAGRAGRESSGFCYRMYTQSQYNEMPENTLPEILRTNITTTILQLLALGIDCEKFDFIDKPSKESIRYGLEQLLILEAVDCVDNPKLTDVGWKMSKFPLDARYSKLLLTAPKFECMEDMLSLVAVMSGESVYILTNDKKEQQLSNHRRFESPLSDHLTLLNIYRAFQNNQSQKRWCHENSLNSRSLMYAREVRAQLSEICFKLNLPTSSCGSNTDQVRKCLITGLFGNTAQLQREGNYLTFFSRQVVHLHPSSVLQGKKSPCVLFSELVQTGKSFIRNVTAIEPEWLFEIMPQSTINIKGARRE